MLIYWAAYGSFSLVEVFTDKIISWFPLIGEFVVNLVKPSYESPMSGFASQIPSMALLGSGLTGEVIFL
jgi:receptor expression-enhancing protein 5/6